MSGVVETVEVDPKQAVGRLLPAGWRVDIFVPSVEGIILYSGGPVHWAHFVPHGERVEVVVEDTPADDVTDAVRQAVQ